VQALSLLPLVVNDDVAHTHQALTLQLQAQGFQSGSLHQAEQSAGLEKGHHCHLAHGPLHGLQLPYPPGWWQLASPTASVTLCSAPMEQAESEKQAEARPHACSSSLLPQSLG